MSEETWIYLIKDNFTGLHKIGRSHDPKGRYKKLCKQDTLMPYPNDFVFVGAWKSTSLSEKELHEIFGFCRKRGEWFDLSEEEVAWIESKYFYIKENLFLQTSLFDNLLDAGLIHTAVYQLKGDKEKEIANADMVDYLIEGFDEYFI
jgi:hypothetical protein